MSSFIQVVISQNELQLLGRVEKCITLSWTQYSFPMLRYSTEQQGGFSITESIPSSRDRYKHWLVFLDVSATKDQSHSSKGHHQKSKMWYVDFDIVLPLNRFKFFFNNRNNSQLWVF